MDFPVCCVCTAILDHEFGAGLALAERPEWHSRTVSALCSIETFRKWYFKTPWLWGTFVRLIIDSATRKDIKAQPEPRFQISGVFQEGNWYSPDEYRDIAPRDIDIIMVGNLLTRNRKEMIPVFGVEVLYKDFSFQDLPYQKPHLWPLGYKIHERCWELSLRVFGSANLERHLDLFIEAVKQRSRVIMSKRHPWVMLRSGGRIYEAGYKELFGRGEDNEIKEDFRYSPMKYMGKQSVGAYFRRSCRRKGSGIPHDPMNIVELRDLISKAIRRRESQKGQRRSSVISSRITLPVDIQMVIVDALHTTSDIQNALAAFNWHLPDTYWRTRLPKDIIYEYKDLTTVNLDWKYLYLGLESLFKSSHGLDHRVRTLDNLEIHGIFLHLLERRDDQEKLHRA